MTNETNLFYTQEADGILGLAETGRDRIKPLYQEMFDQGVIEKRLFSLCLGKNGGRFTMGGYDLTQQVVDGDSVTWFPLTYPYDNYRINFDRITVGSKCYNLR